MTDTDRTRALRNALVDQIARDFRISPPVLAAIARVPRHAFIPGADAETAYVDDAVITRRDAEGQLLSSISQPSTIAQMLEMLDLRPGHRVLEVGAGTGYCAALIAELVGRDGAVTTIDVDPVITDEAARNLDATGHSRVTVTCGDGALGEPDGAPWDRILVSVGAWEPSPEWIAQLAPGGILVLPLAIRRIQRIVAFSPAVYGLRSTRVLAGGFLAQRGRDARPRTVLRVDDAITIESEDVLGFDVDTVREALAGGPVTVWTGVDVPDSGRYDRLIVYIALHHPGLFTMSAPSTVLPDALRAWKLIFGVADGATIGHLVVRSTDPGEPNCGYEIGVAAYGPGSTMMVERLADDVRSWSRIMETDPVLDVFAQPHSSGADQPGAVVLDKRHSRIRATWPNAAGPATGRVSPAPVVHQMRLRKEFLDLVADGKKAIEIRCDDQKRRSITEGDQIVFRCGNSWVRTRVERVSRYATFEELYEHEDVAAINPHRTVAEQLAGIEGLYGIDKRALGAVAIEIRLLQNSLPAKGVA